VQEEQDPVLAEQYYRRTWLLVPDIGVVRRRLPGLFAWLRRERPVEVFFDPGLPIYVHSHSIDPDRLVGELLEAGAYTPATLVHRDFLARAIRAGYVTETIQIVEELVDDDGLELAEVTKLYTQVGRALSDAGEHDQASELLAQAVLLDPSSVEAQVNLGLALKRKGNRREAIAALQRALMLDPDHYWANQLLGLLLEKTKDWGEVIRVGEKAAEVSDNAEQKAGSLALVGRAFLQLNKPSRACEAFGRAYAAKPDEEILTQLKQLDCAPQP
jgi:tetratricopeptide (TPR) repeat protein